MSTIQRFEELDVWQNARGSAGEVRSQLYVALDQGSLSESVFDDVYALVETISRQLFRLIQYLKSRPNSSRVGEEGVAYQIDLDSEE